MGFAIAVVEEYGLSVVYYGSASVKHSPIPGAGVSARDKRFAVAFPVYGVAAYRQLRVDEPVNPCRNYVWPLLRTPIILRILDRVRLGDVGQVGVEHDDMQAAIRAVRCVKTGTVELRADGIVQILFDHRAQSRPVEKILAVAASQNACASARSTLRVPHIGRVGIDWTAEGLSP